MIRYSYEEKNFTFIPEESNPSIRLPMERLNFFVHAVCMSEARQTSPSRTRALSTPPACSPACSIIFLNIYRNLCTLRKSAAKLIFLACSKCVYPPPHLSMRDFSNGAPQHVAASYCSALPNVRTTLYRSMPCCAQRNTRQRAYPASNSCNSCNSCVRRVLSYTRSSVPACMPCSRCGAGPLAVRTAGPHNSSNSCNSSNSRNQQQQLP